MMKFKRIFAIFFLALAGASSAALAEDARMFVRHEVADYAIWKKGYNAYAPQQKKGGVFFQAVYQATDNPNDVTVIHDFHSVEMAKAFAASPDLKATMERIGVKGAPQIWITTKGKK